MLREKSFKIIGWILIVIGLFFNPFVVEWLFSPDGKLDFIWKYFEIAIFNVVLIIVGISIMKIKTRRKIKVILRKIRKLLSNKNIQNIFLLIMIIILTILIIETTFYFLNKESETKRIIKGNHKYIQFDQERGYKGIPNITTNRAIYFSNGTTIYNVTYSIDEFGRRKNKHTEEPPLILFGGSYTFGEGVEDNETLNYHLTNLTNYDLYNYGLPGTGTQHMLALLEDDNFAEEINKTGGKAIYIFIPNHIRRVIGNLYIHKKWYAGWTFPYYKLDKNLKLERKGNFKTGKPITTTIYQILARSQLIKYYKIDLPKHKEKHTYLTYKIIEKSKEIYEEKFNGTFYVLIHPIHNDNIKSLELKELLQENNINILEYNLTHTNIRKEYKIKGDGHPNAKSNKELAKNIAESLNPSLK